MFSWGYPKNKNIKKDLINIISGVLQKGPKEYTIIYGPTGNGKTTIVNEVAKAINVDVLRITEENSLSKDSVNDCIKSINLDNLTTDKKYHIVLIDDFEYFSKKKPFLKFPKYCNFPVIYISSNLKAFDDNFFVYNQHCHRIEVNKLMPSFLFDVLKEKRNELNLTIDDNTLFELSKYAPSVRKALLMLEMGSAGKEFIPNINLFRQLQSRSLTSNINYFTNKYIMNQIHTYSDADCLLLNRFSYFDYLFKSDPQGISAIRKEINKDGLDKIFINKMKEPIEKLNLSFKKKKRKEFKKKVPKKKKPEPIIEKTHNDVSNYY